MLLLLVGLADHFSAFNVFRYITFRTGGALITSALIVFMFGPAIIDALRIRQGRGQPIRADGPQTHFKKAGTPTMGGLMMLTGIIGSVALWGNLSSTYVWVVLMVTIGFGAIGFYDDYLKVTKQTDKGFSGKARLGIEFLIAARFLQALGGAGGLALTRVIVADTSKGISTTRSIAILNLILLLGPGLAPVIGAEIAGLFGWRTIFGALALMGLITIALATRYLPETAAPSGTLNATRIYTTFRDLLAGKAFFRAITGGAFGSTACYAYFVSAPFILTSEMGLSVQAVGYCVGSTLAAAAAGSLLTRSIVGRVRDRLILISFYVIGVLAGLTFLIGAITDMLTPVSVVTISLIILFAAGGLGPVAIGTTLRLAGSNVGSASGLYGCFQMLSGVICSFAAGLFTDHALGCGLVLFLAYLFCVIQFIRLKEQ